MKKILVTGGSGFIGTNLVQSLLDNGYHVLSIDRSPPRCPEHQRIFKNVDILCKEAITQFVNDFSPTHIIHLAARTDLNGKNLNEYYVNTKGVKNLLNAVSAQPSVERCVFTSSMLVCRNGYTPKSDEDYCPSTVYGESKVAGERIIRSASSLKFEWCIVRPTSIWGPWFDIPYKDLFLMIAKGLYFHPGKIDPHQRYGYVGNVVFQIEKLLAAPASSVLRKTFYLSDYDSVTLKGWTNVISAKLKRGPVRTIPEPVVKTAAYFGDFLKKIGIWDFPLTSFRLANMRTDNAGLPLQNIKRITGPLPYTMEEGVERTIGWLERCGLLTTQGNQPKA